MARYIDADALKNSIDEHVYLVHHGFNETEYGCTQYGIHQIIDEAPTIEAIPIKWIIRNRNKHNNDGFAWIFEAVLDDWRKEHDTAD